MGITGNFKMRFIGKPGGKLMKGAPGNFIHGKEYVVPFGHSKWPYWELLEEVPVLKVPEETDSFEETYYVPEDDVTMSDPDEAVIELTTSAPVDDVDANYDLNAPASISPHITWNPSTGAVSPYVEPKPEPEPTEAEILKEEVERLKKALEEATTTPSVPLEEVLEEPGNRDELLAILKDAGVPVKPRTRTTTLRRMVADLEEED